MTWTDIKFRKSVGDRITPSIPLTDIDKVTSSVIEWIVNTPLGSNFVVEAKLDSQTEWITCSNGEALPCITVGQDVSSESLKVRTIFIADDTKILTPILDSLVVKVRQSEDPRVIFGLNYNSVTEYQRTLDKSSEKTVCYVTSGDLVNVVSAGGTRRRETYATANDGDDLEEIAAQALTNALAIDSRTVKTLLEQFEYGSDYDLGDYVTFVTRKGEATDLQIQRISEVYEKNNIEILPEFGESAKTLTGQVVALDERIAKLETVVDLTPRVEDLEDDLTTAEADIADLDDGVTSNEIEIEDLDARITVLEELHGL